MKNFLIYFILPTLFLNLVFINTTLGQSQFKSFNQSRFEKNKVYNEMYHLWWYKNRWLPNQNDTLPYFVDDRNYKGLINYGVKFRARDRTNFTFLESVTRYFLTVDIQKCNYSKKDSIITITGFVSGGWSGSSKKSKQQNHIDIFIGEKTDTIYPCYFGNACYNKIIDTKVTEVKLNNIEIDEYKVIDTFTAFYVKNFSYYRTIPQGNRPFCITGKVLKNTLLSFGGADCYSEIFDIGAMVYEPNKNKAKKSVKIKSDRREIMFNNKLVADIEKQNPKTSESNYYTFTAKAENHLMKRQFALANQTYILLSNQYQKFYARDIHNAIRAAILARDYKSTFFWSEKLAKKNVGFGYFNAKIFKNIKNNVRWKSFQLKYDSIYKDNQKNLNLNLKEQLRNLLNEDQANYGLENRKESEILNETTERLTEQLISLIKNEGYPSEEKIGVYTKNDTILLSVPDFNVLIRHAVQQQPKSLNILNELLDKSRDELEYDKDRSPNHRNYPNACFHIYKGNLYNNKSCGNNELMVRKMIFMFNNSEHFLIDSGDYIISEHNADNPEKYDMYYSENFNLILKLTDDWQFYEK